MVPLKLNLSLKQKLFLLGLLTLTSAMIISLTWWTIGALAPTAATDSGDDLTPVRVSATEKQTLRRVFSIYTSLLPWKEAFIKPQTQGSVTSVFVQVGDLVQKDQKLFSLSSESQRLRAELDQIDFQLRSVDYQVAMALAQKNFISRKEQHQKQLEHRSSKIRARLSVLDNGGAYVSPFDGLISESGLRAGDFVDGTSIQGVRIVDVSKLKMAFWIPQSMASLISIDSEAFVALENSESLAKIIAVSPTVDQKTGSVYVEAELVDPPPSWRAGQYAQVRLTLEKQTEALSIPRSAMIKENGQTFVYKIADEERSPSQDAERVLKVPIKTGIEVADRIEIKSGLEEFDQVVVEGHSGLKDGNMVEVFASD